MSTTRRTFLMGSFALCAAPLAAGAQQAGKVVRIGYLQPGPSAPPGYLEAFRQGLRDHGHVEGQNIVIEHRISSAPNEHSVRVTELVGQKVDVLVTWSTPALVAAKKATSMIPIVGISGDPVQAGLVASLARPGGNLTGLALLTDELEVKKLQLLKEAMPSVTHVAVLWNPDNPVWTSALKRLQEAAPPLNMKLQPLGVRASGELEAAFAAATREKADALLVVQEGAFSPDRQRIADFAATSRLPAIYPNRPYVEAGGLMAHGVDFPDLLRRTAGYVDRILKGARPGDLPIEEATKFQLVINMKTAKALGLTIPQSVLSRADDVIQ